MRLAERIAAGLLRWDRVIPGLLLLLPLLVSATLGLIWLTERGWLLWFLLGTVGFYALVRLALGRMHRRQPPQPRLPGVEPDPGWSAREKATFDRARQQIAQRLATPLPWDTLPAEAVAIVESIALDLSEGRRGVLDFTLPEALLLIDRVALRYRAFLLDHVPLSDRLSVRAMHWLWQKQGTAAAAWETGFLAWRGVRLLVNPAAALLREAERLLSAGVQTRLSEGLRRDAQIILLEEAAQAAVDLYSGRLVAHDSDIDRAVQDAAREPVLAPLTVLVVGQAGAGRSSVIGALADPNAASGGATARGGALRLIESLPLDGTEARCRDVAEAMTTSDLVLWVHRANRPGRAADADLARAFAAALARAPGSAVAPVVHVVTASDLVGAGSTAIEGTIRESIGADSVLALNPLRPGADLAALWARIDVALPAARRAQHDRQRHRLSRPAGVFGNVARAGRGAAAYARRLLRQD